MTAREILDKIETVLSTENPTIDEIESAGDLLFALIVSDPALAFQPIREIRRLSLALSYKPGLAYADGLEGYAHFMMSDFTAALPLMQRAASAIDVDSDPVVVAQVQLGLSNIYLSMGMFAESLEYANTALELSQRIDAAEGIAWAHHALAMVYQEVEDYEVSIESFKDGINGFEKLAFDDTQRTIGSARCLTGIGTSLYKLGDISESLDYHRRALESYRASGNINGESRAINDIGVCLSATDPDEALQLLEQSLKLRERLGNRQAQCTTLIRLAELHLGCDRSDEALKAGNTSLRIAREIESNLRLIQSHEILARIYEAREEWKSAFNHLVEFNSLRVKVSGEDARTRIANLQSIRQAEMARKDAELAKLTAHALGQKNSELEELLAELKRTQAQLVQSEKLASLGQLTAGVAHEIRNPLNFIMNFASLNSELILEVRDLLGDPPVVDSETVHLLEDLVTNTSRIYEHGRRAERIVQGMLDHSRSTGAPPEPTEINRLVQEYTELAFHGMRATHPESTIDIQYSLDEAVGVVEIVGPDFGRVILNLVTNAYQATMAEEQGIRQTIRVSTLLDQGFVVVLVEDSGPGIQTGTEDKIFEPFFTTKNPGDGTGLGLSISHDIIAGTHKGSLSASRSKLGGASFRISIPS